MAKPKIAKLIQQEVTQPDEQSAAIVKTQNTSLANLQLSAQGLFDESKAIWEEFVAFDQEHQLTQRVGAQLWRLTKAVGKPALVLSFKGIQTAIVTVANSENRAALAERFKRFKAVNPADVSLDLSEE